MDVEWFRLPRTDRGPSGLVARRSAGVLAVLIDRGDYWQCAYVIGKGGDARLREQPIEHFGRRLTELYPWLGARTCALTGWDDVRLLVVRLDRLRRWYREGLLLVGDAAHAMSPVGGVGINLAVQDAVATARILGERLRHGRPADVATLRKVQLRRWPPTVIAQTCQRIAHRLLIRRALDGGRADPRGPTRTRRTTPIRLIGRFPVLQGVMARMVAIGPLPEHAPSWARRPSNDA